MKFFKITLSDNSFIFLKSKNINKGEIDGEFQAERRKLELVDIQEISEEQYIKRN